MSNTVITNYTDLNGPSTKADSSVVVIVNKDGSLSVDQNLLGTLMGTDGSQGAGISVVRVGHEGRPDDATDSESDDDKIPHVTLSVDSYYDEPNSIIKYDSGAEMLQSLRIETRENSLVGFQNDHCYTPLTSPSQGVPQRSDSFSGYDEPVLEITHTPPPKPVPQSKKITILDQQILSKGRKVIVNPSESSVILKGQDVVSKSLPASVKSKQLSDAERSSENTESSSISSGDSIPDRDSDSDYKDSNDRSLRSFRKSKVKPRILKSTTPKATRLDPKIASRLKTHKNVLKKDIKEKIQHKLSTEKKIPEVDATPPKDILQPTEGPSVVPSGTESLKVAPKQTPKPVKKEKKTPAHVTALLSDMTSLFSTPDVIRRVSSDGKTTLKPEEAAPAPKKQMSLLKPQENVETKVAESQKVKVIQVKAHQKQKDKTLPAEKMAKGYDLIPQLDDASLAQILQDPSGMPSGSAKAQPNITSGNIMNSPGLAGPLSPTLDLLGGLQPEEEGLTEDLLMHVAQLVESSENLQEVIDKQVLGKVDTVPAKITVQSPFQQSQAASYSQTPSRSVKTIIPRKDPIEIVRRDGRVITLPPIEAPATRSSKRKSQIESSSGSVEVVGTPTPAPVQQAVTPSMPEPQIPQASKQYVNRKLSTKKHEPVIQAPVDKMSAESQESWNSEDDPYRLWCICKQPHNNRFMICCDSCEDWFHGKCVNITKAMGQQMEEQGIEWRCPNCVRKTKGTPKPQNKQAIPQAKKREFDHGTTPTPVPVLIPKDTGSKTNCIVCKRPARASSIYCSDACILKHAQDSLGSQTSPSKIEEPGRSQDKQKADSRVVVFERKSGRLLAGPNAPTAENLRTWLQKNPTFEVVRPGTLNAIKPNLMKRKSMPEGNKVQTMLNFERIPRKLGEQHVLAKTSQQETRDRVPKLLSPREELKPAPQPRTPVATRSQPQYYDSPKPSTSKAATEPKKPARATVSRSLSTYEKAATVSPSTSRRKEAPDAKKKMDSTEPIRENVRKSLQEQLSNRMSESKGHKFTEEEIQQFAIETEHELHELFGRDVGMKYKAKYRSLMFNIKDRKNLTLWQKICDRKITPEQLVRLSPEELASQELAQWRDKEAKHQLELIKKSELDLLAASKTYVLKTHKGEEVMETKESVQTELDPQVPVEDLVIALNDSTVGEEVTNEVLQEKTETLSKTDSKHKKKDRDSSRSKKSSRQSKRDSESRKSRSSRRRSEEKSREVRSTRRSEKKSSRPRSLSKEKSKTDSKEKTDVSERARRRSRSRSRTKSKRRSKSREHSRSTSQGRDRSRSRDRTKKRSSSREAKRRRSSRNKHSTSTEEKPRSRSQENIYSKSKNDSTDSDSVERPKSAMLKEAHPEYDPHEPMITSAFSEEDLRKSGGEGYEDTYKSDVIEEYGNTEYDPTKPFTIDTGVILPPRKYTPKHEKGSEAESDQEPSSTVENSAATVWNGCINMVDVARFYVAAHEVSGSAADLEEDLSPELDIVGRINPDTVWDYIGKMKRTSNKDIIILKLIAANDEEKMQYIALYSYLSSRNRLGVVKVSNTTAVKDFYIVPLAAGAPLPAALLPLEPHAPGLADTRTHLLLAIVIGQRKKRPAPHIPKDITPAKVARESRKRSYTPPVVCRSGTPPARLPLPAYTSPALSTTVKDKIAASLASADDEEAYSPGSSSSGGSAPPAPAPAAPAPPAGPPSMLRSKMEELNRQIEEQKQQIMKMAQADSSVGEDEAYSPSRPMTPPSVVPLADIALPSNLQEILATIKQRSETTSADVDMRNLPLPP